METKHEVTYQSILELFERSKIEYDERLKETDKRFQETDLQMKKTDRKIKELGIQIGGLGNKFGLYNEGLFMPSLIKIVENTFHCHHYTNNSKVKNNGHSFEIDFWGYSDTECFIIDVKSNLKPEAIEQLENTIQQFKVAYPEHLSRKIYGVIAATHFSKHIKEQIINAGFYFISISDDVAKLYIPKKFKPKQW